MKIETAGLSVSRLPSGSTLRYGFMFSLKRPMQMTRVRVEDVTDKQPVVLVDDRAPKIANNQWTGNSRVWLMNKEHFPWMYDGLTTKKLFRMTVSTKDQGEIMLEQPATYDAEVKKVMIQVIPKLKKSE